MMESPKFNRLESELKTAASLLPAGPLC